MQKLIAVDQDGGIIATAPYSKSSGPSLPKISLAPYPNYTAHVADVPVELEGEPFSQWHQNWEVKSVGGKMILRRKAEVSS